MMKNGLARFEYFLDKFEGLLITASKQKNPALWLYQNNARTPLFMLEGLAKMYGGIHNRKKFGKLKEHFKLLEDAIGQIDYYDGFAKELAADKKIPKEITGYLQAQSREKIQYLNEILVERNWLGEDNDRIARIRKKLAKADWQNEKEDIESIQQFYTTAIHKILEFINQKEFHFTNVEKDVHEFRRMIRWLSIYPQALRGCIQLTQGKKAIPAYLAKYQTRAITGSPYNVMPDAGAQKYFLLFDKNRFYALSWLINELGNLKDNGLKSEIIKEAILQTSPKLPAEKNTDAAALAKAYKLSGKAHKTIDQVLTEAGNLTKAFCKEKILETMITGKASVKI